MCYFCHVLPFQGLLADTASNSPVHAALSSNTFAIYGQGVDKELTELVPGILNQLGPDHMANLRRIAESYQTQQQGPGANLVGIEREADDDEDDEPPELVPAEPVSECAEKEKLEDIVSLRHFALSESNLSYCLNTNLTHSPLLLELKTARLISAQQTNVTRNMLHFVLPVVFSFERPYVRRPFPLGSLKPHNDFPVVFCPTTTAVAFYWCRS